MIDALREEKIVNKVGGRFKLSTLIQKRLIQLNNGARPVVPQRGRTNMEVVVEEILQDKIFLDNSNVVNVLDAALDHDTGDIEDDL